MEVKQTQLSSNGTKHSNGFKKHSNGIKDISVLGLSSSRMMYWLGLAVLASFVVFTFRSEKKVMTSIETSLRAEIGGLDDSSELFEIIVNEASSQVNETLAKLYDARDENLELKMVVDETSLQINTTLAQLKDAEEENSELKQQLEELQQQQHPQPQPQPQPQISAFDPTIHDHICSVLPDSGAPSATRLWKDHLSTIFEVSKESQLGEEYNTEEEYARLHKLLEETLTPARMRRAIRHMPTFSQHILDHVMEILQKRLTDPENNPPLRIAVFGGSVTIGRDCIKGKMQYRDCAWPKRFELLVNDFFGLELIEVTNMGIGGTSSSSGTNMVKYWMYSSAELHKLGPDVIINSYSTNDSLPPWGLEWPKDDTIAIGAEKIRNGLQKFVREALESKPCMVPPLVAHVDDYLGPQQPALMGELNYVTEMTKLAKHYDTVGISYGEVVRDIIYRDQDETIFHSKKDVHFGHLGHQTIALSVGFAALQLFINYCDDKHNILASGTNTTHNYHSISKEEMKRDKLYLPPPLTTTLIQSNSTNEYNAAIERAYNNHVSHDCAAHSDMDFVDVDRNPCPIAWISTPGQFDARKIQNFMKQYTITNDGWQAERQTVEGWSNKDGWVAIKANATMQLRFPNVTKNIKTLTIYFLRSYGEKWKDSKAKFTVRRLPSNEDTNGAVVSEFEIAGIHADENFQISPTLTKTFYLSETVRKNETIDIAFDLIGGSHFKVMGMMICNH